MEKMIELSRTEQKQIMAGSIGDIWEWLGYMFKTHGNSMTYNQGAAGSAAYKYMKSSP